MNREEPFYRSKYQTVSLEYFIEKCDTYEDFERQFSGDLLSEDIRIGQYLDSLLVKYDKRAAAVSKDAGLAPLYVRRKRDVVIWFGFMKGQDLDTVNATLIERGMQPLIRN